MSARKLYANGSLVIAGLVAINAWVHLVNPKFGSLDMIVKMLEVLWLFASAFYLLAAGSLSLAFCSAASFIVYDLGMLVLEMLLIMSMGKSDSALFLAELRSHPRPIYWFSLGYAGVWAAVNLVISLVPDKTRAIETKEAASITAETAGAENLQSERDSQETTGAEPN